MKSLATIYRLFFFAGRQAHRTQTVSNDILTDDCTWLAQEARLMSMGLDESGGNLALAGPYHHLGYQTTHGTQLSGNS